METNRTELVANGRTAAETARLAKAARIVDYIDISPISATGPVSSDTVRGYSDVTWELLAAAIDGRPISPATRALVVEMLAARELPQPVDPFAALKRSGYYR